MATAPEKSLLNDTTKSVIYGPDGSVASLPTIIITHEEAKLLREYKKFLLRHRLREALFCRDCWNSNLADGCEAYVTTDQIMIRCRCRARFYQGASL